jgi:SsrA-binding protein
MSELIAQNKKARYEYEFLEKLTAGMVLTGTEIKSIRNRNVSIKEAYCRIKGNELFVHNLHIGEYEQRGFVNHEPLRPRKLLLNSRELKKINKKLQDQGVTVIVTRMFISESGYDKLDIALARGKKINDKRTTIKDRDINIDIYRIR